MRGGHFAASYRLRQGQRKDEVMHQDAYATSLFRFRVWLTVCGPLLPYPRYRPVRERVARLSRVAIGDRKRRVAPLTGSAEAPEGRGRPGRAVRPPRPRLGCDRRPATAPQCRTTTSDSSSGTANWPPSTPSPPPSKTPTPSPAPRRARADQAHQRARHALAAMIRAREPVTFAAVAACAGVSREVLYRTTGLATRIRTARTRATPMPVPETSSGSSPVLAALREHIRRIEVQHVDEVRALRREREPTSATGNHAGVPPRRAGTGPRPNAVPVCLDYAVVRTSHRAIPAGGQA